MDKQTENNSASNQNNASQGNSAEPSFLNKLFGKKETTNQFAIRKEPTLGTIASSETTSTVANNTINYSTNNFNKPFVHAGSKLEETVAVAAPEPATASTAIPPFSATDDAVNTAQATDTAQQTESAPEKESEQQSEPVTAKPNMKNPENWAAMQKLPKKHRRLFIVIAIAVALLIALWLLKPSSNDNTVNDIQSNNNGAGMPIEFQPLDPNQAVENVDMNNATPPAEAQPADPNAQPVSGVAAEPMVQNAPTPVPVPGNPETAPQQGVNPPAQPNAAMEPPAPQPPVAAPAPVAPQAAPATTTNTSREKTNQEQIAREQAQAKAEKARQAQLAREKAKAEQKARAEKAAAEKAAAEKARADRIAAEKAKAEQQRAKQQAAERARAQAALNGAPMPAEPKPSNSGSSKTLVIPASTTLFQVFRNNGLDIRDVNAMTKAGGAGNVLSNFRPGDKVQISTNSEGRVTSMRLSDGSVFTRQTDGSYKYRK